MMHEVLPFGYLITGMLGDWQAMAPFLLLPFVVLLVTFLACNLPGITSH